MHIKKKREREKRFEESCDCLYAGFLKKYSNGKKACQFSTAQIYIQMQYKHRLVPYVKKEYTTI